MTAIHFYCAMHYSVKCSLVFACCLSVRLSVCPSICDVVDQDHIG